MAAVILDCRMAQWSGVGRYTRGLVRALAAIDGLSLILVTARGDEPILARSPSVTVLEADRHPFSARGMLELGGIVDHARADLLHCLHFPTPWRTHVPMVVTLHDLTPLVVPASMPSTLRRAVYRSLNARAVRGAGQVIVPSDSTARDVERLLGAPLGQMRVIPEAADDFAAGEVGDLPQGLINDRARYVLSMGNTKAHKDLPCLLAAFQRVLETRPDVHLLLVGEEPSGYLDAHLTGDARSRVRFTGRVDDPQLRALYKSASVFAFPSRYEGFGLPPLEAMSFGSPVLAAKAASLPEVVGDAAVLFPPGDADALASELARMLDDAESRRVLGEKGRARAAEFTWARTARQTVDVYTEVLLSAGG